MLFRSCNKRQLTASDYQEGNRRDCSMSGNQTSSKEGEVQCAVTVVCMYVCLISYMSDSKERDSSLPANSWPSACIYPSSCDTNTTAFCLVFRCFLRTSAPSDTFGNLLRYYEVPPYSLLYTLSEAHVTRLLSH